MHPLQDDPWWVCVPAGGKGNVKRYFIEALNVFVFRLQLISMTMRCLSVLSSTCQWMTHQSRQVKGIPYKLKGNVWLKNIVLPGTCSQQKKSRTTDISPTKTCTHYLYDNVLCIHQVHQPLTTSTNVSHFLGYWQDLSGRNWSVDVTGEQLYIMSSCSVIHK